MNRIHVIGTSGSGKSTLALKIADRLKIDYIPTDPIFWQKGWFATPSAQVTKMAHELFARDRYAMDGNFDNLRDSVWRRADCIVWLDYPFMLVISRVAKRNLQWWITGAETWSNNRMTLKRALSGIQYSAQSYHRKKLLYPRVLAEMNQTEIVRLKNPMGADAWLRNL